jgi:hypothetical protein
VVDPETVRAGAEVVRAGAAVYSALTERAARQRSSAEARVQNRARLRRELDGYLRPKLAEEWNPEMIVIDAARLDAYPEIDERFRFRALSPWFKVEAEKLRDNELGVALAWTTVRIRRGIARETLNGGETVLLTGLIPFDSIIAFDPNGYGPDPYPTLFCHFDQRYGAYREMAIYRREERERVKGVRMARRRQLRHLPGDLRLHWAIKGEQRRFEKEVEAERVRLESTDQ